mmetsp:Transcript_108414/g.294032  ORF Transcript_108414/g.294032 Transcript_108414/m.294032 type:complete len:350 (-) Transcript_108414:8-1057(-)
MSVTPISSRIPTFDSTTPYQSPLPARQLSQLNPCNKTMLDLSAKLVISAIASNRHPLFSRRCRTFSLWRSFSCSWSCSSSASWSWQSWSSCAMSMSIMLGVRLMLAFSSPSSSVTRWRLQLRRMPVLLVCLGMPNGASTSSSSRSSGSPAPESATASLGSSSGAVPVGAAPKLTFLALEAPEEHCRLRPSWPSAAATGEYPEPPRSRACFICVETSGTPQAHSTTSCTWPPPVLRGRCSTLLGPLSHTALPLPLADCMITLNSSTPPLGCIGTATPSEVQSGNSWGVVTHGTAPSASHAPSSAADPQMNTAWPGFVPEHLTWNLTSAVLVASAGAIAPPAARGGKKRYA